MLTLFEVELGIIIMLNSNMKLFMQQSNSSGSSYNNKKMALLTGKTREADGYYFLLLFELVFLVIQFPTVQCCGTHGYCYCTRYTREKKSLTTPAKSINGRGYRFGVNMNS